LITKDAVFFSTAIGVGLEVLLTKELKKFELNLVLMLFLGDRLKVFKSIF